MKALITSVETRIIPAIGTCEMCKKEELNLLRTIFLFEGITCNCHSPYHFEVVTHCQDCKPTQPTSTKIELLTDDATEDIKEYNSDNEGTGKTYRLNICHICGKVTENRNADLCSLCAAGH